MKGNQLNLVAFLILTNIIMEIFGVHIFTSDAQAFLDFSVNEKVEWIKKYTNQKDDDLINEFLSNLPQYKNGSECLNCNSKQDANNINSGNDAEGKINIEPGSTEGNGKRTVSKSRRRNKTA